MSVESPTVIRADRLTKRFGATVAVNSVGFKVFKQECFGFLGPNGAGKSTTVRMMQCFTEPSEGTLEVLSKDVHKEARYIKARIGVCSQENNLDPDLNVWDNLRVFARYFDLTGPRAQERCERLLKFSGLYLKRHSKIEELSGGMKRRLMIARSLLNDPELLILDEPTTGLDPQARHKVWESIIALRRQGVSVVLTTHYMDEAAHLCDRILIMDHGRILVEGRPSELIAQYVGSNVIEADVSDADLEAYLASKEIPYEKTSSHLFAYIKDGQEAFADIIKKSCSGQCTLRMANLEDVFLKFTGRELRE